MLSVLRASALLVVAASTVVVACSGSDVATVSSISSGGNSTSSGGRTSTSGYPGTSGASGGSDDGDNGTNGSSKPPLPSDRIDVASVRSITVGHDVCGKPPGSCMDAQSFTIDFDTATLTHTTCVEIAVPDAGPFGGKTTDAKESHKLTGTELKEVLEALSGVRTSTAKFNGFDGPIDTLEVVSKNGTQLYSPFAGCSQEKFQKIEDGFEEVWKAVSDL